MPRLDLDDLRCGDLLITKYQGTLTHKVISFGSLFSGNFGTSNYVHAQIVCWDTVPNYKRPYDGPVMIAESHAEGLHIEQPYSPATVFRLGTYDGPLSNSFTTQCVQMAADVAIELTGRQQPNDSFARYNFVGAARSLFLTTRVSDNVKTQLRQIEAGTSHDRLFCSQFVVICYQVAILRLVKSGHAPQSLLPFELDAKSMEPAYLVSYLRRNPQRWRELGEFPGGLG